MAAAVHSTYRASTVNEEDAQTQLFAHVPGVDVRQLHCQDRRFLVKYMPAGNLFFITAMSLSTFKELVKAGKPRGLQCFQETSVHTALQHARVN
jgi:oligoribonuclease (3'-5' exoribonuclease)